MRDDLREAIPELDRFRDTTIRDRVLAVFEDALNQGGWTVGDLERMPFTLLLDPCPASMLEHIRGVTGVSLVAAERLAETYGERMPIDHDRLLAGALLHDIGKLVEMEEKHGTFRKSYRGVLLRHPFSGMALAARHGLSEEVQHIIALHAKEGTGARRLAEAHIVHHADFINFEPFHG